MPRIFGEFSLVVTDPVRFIVGYTGQAAQGDNDQVLHWVKGLFLNGVKTTLGELCEVEGKSVLQAVWLTTKLANAFVANAPDLNEIGVRILQMGEFNINFTDEDRAAPRRGERRDREGEPRREDRRGAGEGQAVRARSEVRAGRAVRAEPRRQLPELRGGSGDDRRGPGHGRSTASATAASRARACRWRSASAWPTRWAARSTAPAGRRQAQQPAQAPELHARRRDDDVREVQHASARREVLRRVRRTARPGEEVLHRLRQRDGHREVLRELRHPRERRPAGVILMSLGSRAASAGGASRRREPSADLVADGGVAVFAERDEEALEHHARFLRSRPHRGSTARR